MLFGFAVFCCVMCFSCACSFCLLNFSTFSNYLFSTTSNISTSYSFSTPYSTCSTRHALSSPAVWETCWISTLHWLAVHNKSPWSWSSGIWPWVVHIVIVKTENSTATVVCRTCCYSERIALLFVILYALCKCCTLWLLWTVHFIGLIVSSSTSFSSSLLGCMYIC